MKTDGCYTGREITDEQFFKHHICLERLMKTMENLGAPT
jgi:hypothetical protein